jgi:hypothetical protein
MSSQRVLLIVDTNILYSPNDVEVISAAFSEKLIEARKYAELQLVIPRICIQEIIVQKCGFAESHLTKAAKSLGILARLTSKPTSNIQENRGLRDAVARAILRWCHINNARIARLPISKIDWKAIVHAALWRLPPFSPETENSEKGFKDALVLETALHEWEQNPDRDVIFITNDQRLRTAAGQRVAKTKSFTTFESLEECINYLKLSFEKRSNDFTTKVLAAARSVFFRPNDPNCLFYRFQVVDRIHKENPGLQPDDGAIFHPMEILVPKAKLFLDIYAGQAQLPPLKWRALSDEKVHIHDPVYVESDAQGTMFHWSSDITLARLYQQGNSTRFATFPARYIRLTKYRVFWRSDVSKDAKITNEQFEGLNWVSDKAEIGEDRLRYQYSLPTDLDLMLGTLRSTQSELTTGGVSPDVRTE